MNTKKQSNTYKLSITIEQELFKEFKKYCNENCFKISTKINDLIKKEMIKLKIIKKIKKLR